MNTFKQGLKVVKAGVTQKLNKADSGAEKGEEGAIDEEGATLRALNKEDWDRNPVLEDELIESIPASVLHPIDSFPVWFSGDQTDINCNKERTANHMNSQASLSYIRNDWIRRQMKDCEQDFVTTKPLRILVGTYNVNGKKLQGPLEPWLSWPVVGRNPGAASESGVIPPMEGNESSLPDIYVCGFQEIVDLNVQNALSESSTKERSNTWMETIKQTINIMSSRYSQQKRIDVDQYELVAMKHLVGIMICVLVLRKHLSFVKSVQVSNAATGVMGVVGNKGGSSIRMQIYDSSICFVCAHLAAHRENVEGRNSDFRTINSKTSFRVESTGDEMSIPSQHHSRVNAHSLDILSRGNLQIEDHDLVIWLGDFNYRIDCAYPDELVFDHVNANNLTWLNENDQLNQERRAGRVFRGFIEPPLRFLPTYKFQVNTDDYDRRPEKKVRAPAWCDRVLIKTLSDAPPLQGKLIRENQFKVRLYDRVMDLRYSDHKPVVAIIDFSARIILDDQRKGSYERVLHALDKWPTEASPSLELDRTELNFSSIFYRESVVKEFTITSNGAAPAAWRFIPRPEGVISSPWFTVTPAFGMLIPGESMRIRVHCFVGATTKQALQNYTNLDDLLIIRVEKGQDYPIKLSGNLTPSCFGSDLPTLLSTPYPMRSTQEQKNRILAAIASNSSPQLVPKELHHMLDHLWQTGGMKAYHIFLVPGDADEMRVVRQCVDSGLKIPLDRCGPHSVAAVVLEFLGSLSSPIVPPDMFPKMSDLDPNNPDSQTWSSRWFRSMPNANFNTMIYVVSFVRDLLHRENQAENRLNTKIISPCFARVLFRPDLAAENAREKSAQSSGIVGEFSNWLIGDTGLAKESSATNTAEAVMQHLLSIDIRALI